jgi:hypothetical protein
MSGPLIFNSRSTVRPGKLEDYRAAIKVVTDLVESKEPRMIAFTNYASEDGTDVSTVQVHPDAESLDTHLKIFFEEIYRAHVADALDSYEVNVFGNPSESARQQLAQLPTMFPGVQVRILPVHQAGFLRPQPL